MDFVPSFVDDYHDCIALTSDVLLVLSQLRNISFSSGQLI